MARRPAASQAACGRGAWQWLWSGSDFRRLRRSRLVLNLRFRTDDMLPEGAASRRSATAVERLAGHLGRPDYRRPLQIRHRPMGVRARGGRSAQRSAQRTIPAFPRPSMPRRLSGRPASAPRAPGRMPSARQRSIRSAATVAHLRPTGPYRPSPARHTCRQTHQARGHETAIATDRAALLAPPSRPDAFSLGLCTYYLPAVVADGRACSLGGATPTPLFARRGSENMVPPWLWPSRPLATS